MKNKVLTIARKIIHKQYGDWKINILGINLTIDASDAGGRQYSKSRSYEEIVDPLYTNIDSLYSPSLVIDIGANYGLLNNKYDMSSFVA